VGVTRFKNGRAPGESQGFPDAVVAVLCGFHAQFLELLLEVDHQCLLHGEYWPPFFKGKEIKSKEKLLTYSKRYEKMSATNSIQHFDVVVRICLLHRGIVHT
jgi:hypothetical protein